MGQSKHYALLARGGLTVCGKDIRSVDITLPCFDRDVDCPECTAWAKQHEIKRKKRQTKETIMGQSKHKSKHSTMQVEEYIKNAEAYARRLEQRNAALTESVNGYRVTLKRVHEAYQGRLDEQAGAYLKQSWAICLASLGAGALAGYMLGWLL